MQLHIENLFYNHIFIIPRFASGVWTHNTLKIFFLDLSSFVYETCLWSAPLPSNKNQLYIGWFQKSLCICKNTYIFCELIYIY
jgi:hypothetical protein